MDSTQFQTIIEDVTETKVMMKTLIQYREEEIQERKERQKEIDDTLKTLEIKIDDTSQKVNDALVAWKVVKYIGGGIISLLLAIITFDWTGVASAWHKLTS